MSGSETPPSAYRRPSVAFGAIATLAALAPLIWGLHEGTTLTSPGALLELTASVLAIWFTGLVSTWLLQNELRNELKVDTDEQESRILGRLERIEGQLNTGLRSIEGFSIKSLAREEVISSTLSEIRENIHDGIESIERTTSDSLRIEKHILRTEHSRQALRLLTEICPCDIDHEYVRQKHAEKIIESLHHTRELVGKLPPLEFRKDNESFRMRELLKVIEYSRHSVCAVTVDGGDYLEEFWNSREASMTDYININARRSKIVERLLIIREGVATGELTKQREIVDRIHAFHKKNNIDIRILVLEKLPDYLRSKLDASFLVSDDIVTSKSYSFSDENKSGWINFTDTREASDLKRIFLDLWARDDWVASQ